VKDNKKAGSGHLKRVAVAMSGGVDSSVAAALLQKRGYEVIGLTMKLYDHDLSGKAAENVRGCCSMEAIHRAEAVCHKLNIPHYSLDLMNGFDQYVIRDFVSEYISGRTPNPCVRCNTYLKWGLLFDKMRMLDCHLLSTGHYARIERSDGGEFRLLRAADHRKDQAYALWGITADKLPFTLFPLGDLPKSRVREIAAELGLKTALTPESQEICFIPDGHYAEFLRHREPDFFSSLRPGELIEEEGTLQRQIGHHPGYPFFTVGQRKGLGGGHSQPRFVLRIEPQSNRLIIGSREMLLEKAFLLDKANWLVPPPHQPLRAQVQVRYRSPAHPALISPLNPSEASHDHCFLVEFDEPVEALSPGQSAVFFRGDRLLGGGRILKITHLQEKSDDYSQEALNSRGF